MNGILLLLTMAMQSATPPLATAPDTPPQVAEVTTIPDELQRAFERNVINVTRSPEARLHKLVEFVFDEGKLGVTYQPDTTRTIAESYQARKVNCLSSTLLIVNLARQAGLAAYGQQIDRTLSWSANGDIAFQSKHANAIIEVGERRYVVDVDSQEGIATNALRPITDQLLYALYYGNRAMELLASGNTGAARAWIDAALALAPDDAGLLNNAGIISLREGNIIRAEERLLAAIKAAPDDMSTLSNLIALYERAGNAAQAAQWRDRAGESLRGNPYYQYTLARQQELGGNYRTALKLYRRAARLTPNEHRFQFGIARTHFLMGNLHKAERALASARALSAGESQARYADKLAALKRMRH